MESHCQGHQNPRVLQDITVIRKEMRYMNCTEVQQNAIIQGEDGESLALRNKYGTIV